MTFPRAGSGDSCYPGVDSAASQNPQSYFHTGFWSQKYCHKALAAVFFVYIHTAHLKSLGSVCAQDFYLEIFSALHRNKTW